MTLQALFEHQHEWRLLYVTSSKTNARFYCIHCLKQRLVRVEHEASR